MDKSGQPVRTAVQLIAKEAEEAGCSKWDVLKVIKDLDEETDKNMDDLRRKTVDLLQKINPKAAEIYASYNRLHVYTSAEHLETFDRGNIIKSLLRETEITRGVAEKIGSEVEAKVKDLNLSYLNTSLIREMADVKLLEYGHEAIHQQYTRVGMPVHEVRKKIENEPFHNKEVLAEYNWLQVIPPQARDAHFSCDVFLSRAEDFSTRPYACSFEPSLAGQTFEEALVELVEQFSRLQPFYSLPLNLNALNLLLSRQLPKGKKNLFNAAKLACRALNALYPATGLSYTRPVVGLDLFLRDPLEGFSKQENQAMDFANEFVRAYNEGVQGMRFDLVLCLENKYQLKLLDSALLADSALNFLNCRNAPLRPLNGLRASEAEAILFDGSLNLLKQAVLCKDSRRNFDAKVKELCGALQAVADKKAGILKARVYLGHLGGPLASARHTLDLFGLFDSPRALKDGLSEKECLDDTQAILALVADSLGASWNLSAQRNDFSTARFTDYLQNRLNFPVEHRKTQEDFRRFGAASKKGLLLRNKAGTRAELEEVLGENTQLITFSKAP